MLDIATIKSHITEDDVVTIMDSMGIPLASTNSQALVFPSVCHKKDYMNSRPHLWYYINSASFFCYSCHYSGDIISLVGHVRKCSFQQSVAYICATLHIEVSELEQRDDIDNWKKDLYRWLPNAELPPYDTSILAAFDRLYPSDWLEYGITGDSMDKFGIGWYGRQACISIPVFQDGRLIGVRGRYTRPQDTTKGKYRPITMLDGTVLKFSSGLALYGYDQNRSKIEKSRQVLLFESEKSVLKADSWGIHNALAVFGSNISKRHIDMLLDLGVNDVVLCMDSDYHTIGDDDFKFFVVKMKKLTNKLKPYFNVSIVYNNQGYDGYKFSPVDFTKEQFDVLYDKRAVINK